MTTYIITRHAASRKWILDNLPCQSGDTIVQNHLTPDVIRQGDVVVGVLPLYVIAEIYQRGATFYAFDIAISESWRNRELSEQDLLQCHPKLTQYTVIKGQTYA